MFAWISSSDPASIPDWLFALLLFHDVAQVGKAGEAQHRHLHAVGKAAVSKQPAAGAETNTQVQTGKTDIISGNNGRMSALKPDWRT